MNDSTLGKICGKTRAKAQITVVKVHVVRFMPESFQSAEVYDRAAVGEDRSKNRGGYGNANAAEFGESKDGFTRAGGWGDCLLESLSNLLWKVFVYMVNHPRRLPANNLLEVRSGKIAPEYFPTGIEAAASESFEFAFQYSFAHSSSSASGGFNSKMAILPPIIIVCVKYPNAGPSTSCASLQSLRMTASWLELTFR